jgi:hypothetical protein
MTGAKKMDQQHLEKLSPDVRDFVLSTECDTKIRISVIENPKRNGRGHNCEGTLCCEVTPNSITIHAPTTGYFPDGAVVHEVLHARRLLIDHAPRLIEPENHSWDSYYKEFIPSLDNALEHLFIIPEELKKRPERQTYWHEQLRYLLLQELPRCQDLVHQKYSAAMYFMLLNLTLDEPATSAEIRLHLQNLKLLDFSNNYLATAISAKESKEKLTQQTFDFFGLPRSFADFAYYVSGVRSTRPMNDD